VAWPAEPHNIERFGIVVVMGLQFCLSFLVSATFAMSRFDYSSMPDRLLQEVADELALPDVVPFYVGLSVLSVGPAVVAEFATCVPPLPIRVDSLDFVFPLPFPWERYYSIAVSCCDTVINA
jgi:hypothetical protein